MTDEQFKAELTLFAGHVEQKKARGILVDVGSFRHRPGPDIHPWRVKNISNRYAAAGVQRQAFLFPKCVFVIHREDEPASVMLNGRPQTENPKSRQSAPG